MSINTIRIRVFALVLGVALMGAALFAQVAWAPPATGPTTRPTSPALEATRVGWLSLKGELHDGPPPMAFLSGAESHRSLRKVIAQLQYVAKEPAYKGVVLFMDNPAFTSAQGHEIAAAMRKVSAAGKKVMVFSETYDLHTYLLACAADKILLQKKGEMELLGIDLEEMYLAGLLAKLHMKADFLQIGKYKGAEEPLTRTGPSPEWTQNIDALLDDLYNQALAQIAAARHLTRDQLEKAFADCFALSDADYVARHLVDQLVDRDMKEATGPAFGDEFTWDTDMGQVGIALSMDNPLAFFKLLFQEGKPQITRASIALVHAYGVIHSGDGADSAAPNAGLFGGPSIGSRTFIRALGTARDNDLIKGVVIRIDSPGGSALASEMIWQAVHQVAEKKPVYVSIGSMAASGGYYLASAGHQIYASPNSIVGSIGVVGGKLVLGEFYDWIGINVTQRSRGPMADAFNSVKPFTVDQKAALTKAFERTYEQFVQRVKSGRGQRVKDLDAVAQGRLFSGNQGVTNGLVDKIGGVDQALADIAARLKLEPGKYDVIDLPEPLSLPDYLDQLFGASESAPLSLGKLGEQAQLLSAARHLLGDRAWAQVQPVLSGMTLLRSEHVLTLMPTAIIVK